MPAFKTTKTVEQNRIAKLRYSPLKQRSKAPYGKQTKDTQGRYHNERLYVNKESEIAPMARIQTSFKLASD